MEGFILTFKKFWLYTIPRLQDTIQIGIEIPLNFKIAAFAV